MTISRTNGVCARCVLNAHHVVGFLRAVCCSLYAGFKRGYIPIAHSDRYWTSCDSYACADGTVAGRSRSMGLIICHVSTTVAPPILPEYFITPAYVWVSVPELPPTAGMVSSGI